MSNPVFIRDVAKRKNGARVGLFLCRCGAEYQTNVADVRAGKSKTCGCSRGEAHGMKRSAEYHSWCAMKRRCNTESDRDFARYGGRGITVCDRWQSFTTFLADMGTRPPGTSLDRIDNNKGYEPGNCRWATRSEQNGNRTNLRRVMIAGKRKTVAQWLSDGVSSQELDKLPSVCAHGHVVDSVRHGRTFCGACRSAVYKRYRERKSLAGRK